MSWNDWEAAWRRQTPPIGEAADIVEIKQSLETKRRKLACTILLRNGAEGGTGIVLAIVLAGIGWYHGPAGWPLAVSAALVFAVACVFIADQMRSWRSRVGAEASLLGKIEAEIAELWHQGRLVRTWWAWYLVPCLAAILIGFITLGRLTHGAAPPEFLRELGTTPLTAAWIVVLVASFAFLLQRVWRTNRQTLANIRARITELEKLRGSLSSPGGET